ncbi:hypothetical protein GUJ93_ZPchr0012g19782 [Zizania palustris]|uniref:Uncharacterized protein n=1 Tax=Zizania palustris TaxID=103762 RepID=A0A8J5WNB4_ZIZPA|nr:hypothetical protein GUJ93_ZPchr0012g19782 [Zizania palustris]
MVRLMDSNSGLGFDGSNASEYNSGSGSGSDEIARANAISVMDMPKDIPLPTQGKDTCRENVVSYQVNMEITRCEHGIKWMVRCTDGPMFIRAINTEGEVKKEYIVEKILAVIDEIGAQNISQLQEISDVFSVVWDSMDV